MCIICRRIFTELTLCSYRPNAIRSAGCRSHTVCWCWKTSNIYPEIESWIEIEAEIQTFLHIPLGCYFPRPSFATVCSNCNFHPLNTPTHSLTQTPFPHSAPILSFRGIWDRYLMISINGNNKALLFYYY